MMMIPNGKEPNDHRAEAEALARYTDALLSGQPSEVGMLPEFGDTVEQLARALPHVAPPERLQQRVLRQVRTEWGKAQAPWWAGIAKAWGEALGGLKQSLRRQPAWGAIAALIVIGVLLALVVPWTTEVPGTATGGPSQGVTVILAATLTLAILVGIGFWWRRRR